MAEAEPFALDGAAAALGMGAAGGRAAAGVSFKHQQRHRLQRKSPAET